LGSDAAVCFASLLAWVVFFRPCWRITPDLDLVGLGDRFLVPCGSDGMPSTC
jgi:hypothetical protein